MKTAEQLECEYTAHFDAEPGVTPVTGKNAEAIQNISGGVVCVPPHEGVPFIFNWIDRSDADGDEDVEFSVLGDSDDGCIFRVSFADFSVADFYFGCSGYELSKALGWYLSKSPSLQ